MRGCVKSGGVCSWPCPWVFPEFLIFISPLFFPLVPAIIVYSPACDLRVFDLHYPKPSISPWEIPLEIALQVAAAVMLRSLQPLQPLLLLSPKQ